MRASAICILNPGLLESQDFGTPPSKAGRLPALKASEMAVAFWGR